ncbi:hypothetical protein GJ744_003418 [Endocarpon pusillum]|uniref:Uncharacterized protein n=1 Tax=Endocarpon pusillum TaxID=364733 RepID=A0A8H7A6Q4_9EURO|nr:hypothetical protein GJ744_003418 [Endocarpon pusillum]
MQKLVIWESRFRCFSVFLPALAALVVHQIESVDLPSLTAPLSGCEGLLNQSKEQLRTLISELVATFRPEIASPALAVWFLGYSFKSVA